MIENIANIIAKKIVEHNIKSENEDIYSYGAQILLNTLCSILIVVLLGVLFDEFIGTIIFLLSYCSLRFFAGGLHVSTNGRCIMTFVSGYIAVCFILKLITITLDIEIILGLITINLITWILAPVDNRNNPISLEKKKIMKKRSFFISLIITIVIFVLLYNDYGIGKWAYAGLSWACLILVVGKIKNILTSRRYDYEKIN